MVSTKAKRGTQFGGAGAREDDAVQQAGINAVFAELRDMGPQFLRLQQSLIGGLARSQEREAARLAKEDKKDPLVAAAEARAERAGALGAELAKAGEAARRLVKGFSRGGMFHGYVIDTKGEPATGYVVQLSNAAAGTDARKALKAKTDETGYFRIDFDAPTRKARRIEDVITMAAGTREKAAKAEGAKEGSNETGDAKAQYEGARVEVAISSPAKKVVFRDPDPPAFDDPTAAVFRFYPLIDLKSAGRGTRPTASPRPARAS